MNMVMSIIITIIMTANAAVVTNIITMTTMMTMTNTSIASIRMSMLTNTAARTRARN